MWKHKWVAVAVQMTTAYYSDDHNNHGFNKKPCKAFCKKNFCYKNLKMFFFCTCPEKAQRPTETMEGDCEAVVTGY